MNLFLQHARSNAVAYLALFVALGGTSYAALSLPPGSVGAAQIRNHVITPVKFDNRYINGSVRAWAVVGAKGRVLAGGGRPKGLGDAPFPGTYQIAWGVSLPRSCSTLATINSNHSPITERIPVPGNPSVPFTAGYAVAYTVGGARSGTNVLTYNQAGQLTPLGFDVAVIC